MMRKTTMTRLTGLLLALTVLTGCSDDERTDKDRLPLQIVASSQSFVEERPISTAREAAPAWTTRAWTPPESYVLYSALNDMFEDQTNLINNTIHIFFTRNNETPEEGLFLYASNNTWRSNVEATSGQEYFLYGFIPHTSNATASISSTTTPGDNSSYSSGAVLTLRGMPTITPSDVCVVVGAKNGPNANSDGGLTTGLFAYTASADSYIYLLFDHLYSAMRLSVRVDDDYDKLRTIWLKNIVLKAYTSNGVTEMKKRTNITIVLNKTLDGSSPISSIAFEPDATSDIANDTIFKSESDAGLRLTPTASDFRGCFVPSGVTKFKVTSTYDVYDKQNNLIRKDCKATNQLDISQLYNLQTESLRGRMYSVNLMVSPTYLYVLSEPDLDNPTVTLSEPE